MRKLILSLCAVVLLCSCGSEESAEDFNLRRVTLPDGTVVRVETMVNQVDMTKGMMFRNSLPEGRGMLFIHREPGKNAYWMYQVKIPLDLIWMDVNGNVTEIVENAPPCDKVASQCPTYGGQTESQIVLELPGGYARKHGVQVGSVIRL